MDEQALRSELQRARQEAAASRVELSEYKKAFTHLDAESKAFMLDTLSKMGSGEDPEEVASRLGSLTVTWMGDQFVPWVEGLTGIPMDLEQRQPAGEPEMDEAQLEQALAQFQQNIMQSIDARLGEQAATSDKRERFNAILGEVQGLGYDPESWQGKLLLQTAADETGADIAAAHAVLQGRGIQPADIDEAPVDAETIAQVSGVHPVSTGPIPAGITSALVPPASSVPPTGGQVGGAGVPESPTEEIVDFGTADQATFELISGLAGSE